MDSAHFNSPRPAQDGVRTLRHKLTREQRARTMGRTVEPQRMAVIIAAIVMGGALLLDLALTPHPALLAIFGFDGQDQPKITASAPETPTFDQKLTIHSVVEAPQFAPEALAAANSMANATNGQSDPITTGAAFPPLQSQGSLPRSYSQEQPAAELRDGARLSANSSSIAGSDAQHPPIQPAQLCDLLKTSGLASARWQQDSFDKSEWSCLTDVEHIGAASLFGSIRGPNPQTLGMVRFKMSLAAGADGIAIRQKTKALVLQTSHALGFTLPSEAINALMAAKEYVYTGDDYQFSFRPQLDDPNRINIFMRPLHIQTIVAKTTKSPGN